MRLRADAVVLVFHQRVLKVLERLLGICGRAGQHEPDGMKQPHVRLVETMLCCQLQRAADIAQQHVGALHPIERLIVSLRDRFLHQALFEPDA